MTTTVVIIVNIIVFDDLNIDRTDLITVFCLNFAPHVRYAIGTYNTVFKSCRRGRN